MMVCHARSVAWDQSPIPSVGMAGTSPRVGLIGPARPRGQLVDVALKSTARAASSLATGMRNGEHET
jgi:hypothetical protein